MPTEFVWTLLMLGLMNGVCFFGIGYVLGKLSKK